MTFFFCDVDAEPLWDMVFFRVSARPFHGRKGTEHGSASHDATLEALLPAIEQVKYRVRTVPRTTGCEKSEGLVYLIQEAE